MLYELPGGEQDILDVPGSGNIDTLKNGWRGAGPWYQIRLELGPIIKGLDRGDTM